MPCFTQSCQLFPEIAEDAAVYFHMDEKRTDFEEQFETFYYLDGIEKKKLIEKQNERLKHFSWKNLRWSWLIFINISISKYEEI